MTTDGYRGIVGAVPYAIRESDSWLFRSYAAVSALFALGVGALVGLGLVVLIARTTGGRGGSLTLSRAFYVVVGLLVVGPVVGPALLVARRHRRDGSSRRYDAAMAASGYLVVCSLYAALVITVPPGRQATPSGVLAPVVAGLYGLPPVAAIVPPVAAVGLCVAAHRRFG